jgi:histidinol-phosphate aminotransferase
MKNYHYNLKAMAELINNNTKVIYLANPDNPTGTFFKKDDFDRFMKLVPSRVIVLLDEAYFEYASHLQDYPDSMSYRYDNVITLRTFSKVYGLAGFRVGYGFANEKLISNLMKVKLPFEPSTLGQVAGCAAIDDERHLLNTLKINEVEKIKFEAFFTKNNINFIPTSANFITLIFSSNDNAKSFCDNMLNNGVILRNLESFGLPECIRITIGTEEENDYFLKNLKKMELDSVFNR